MSVVLLLVRWHSEAESGARPADAVPDALALAEVRHTRDVLVGDLIAGTVRWDDHGTPLQHHIAEADVIADRRYAEAETAATLDGQHVQREGLRARLLELQTQDAEIAQVIEGLRVSWSTLLADSDMPELALEDASAWAGSRIIVLQSWDAVKRAREDVAVFDRATLEQAERLAQVLGQSRVDSVSPPKWLAALLVEARSAQQDATTLRVKREGLKSQINSEDETLTIEASGLADLLAERKAWALDWSASCTAAGIPVATSASGLDRILAAIETLRLNVIAYLDEQSQRIAPMSSTIARFTERARSLVDSVATDLRDQPVFAALRSLGVRLREARTAQSMSSNNVIGISELTKKINEQRGARADALALIDPLLVAAGTLVPTELDTAIALFEAEQLHDADCVRLREAILDHGEGRDLEQLREEVASIAVEHVAERLEAALHGQADADAEWEAAREAATLAKAALRACEDNDGSAAQALSATAIAQRGMTDAIETFIGLHTQVMLLDHALTRYRDEQQAPLLSRASTYFQELTCGEHTRLIADVEGDGVALWSRRADGAGSMVPVGGMSDGTRDQLYLALRLAAVDLHLEHNTALPFIADDLFVNFDDARTGAALKALATLATRTQTLYFTHHAHLVDLAREAVGDRFTLIDLSS